MATQANTMPRCPFTGSVSSKGLSIFRKQLLLLVLILVSSAITFAQESNAGKDTGRVYGNYAVQQSVEIGSHFVSIAGNESVYDTFVNLHTGPRLLSQDLSVRSINQHGTIFDNLSISSFGYGGDPNDATRIRLSKDKFYDFSANYRRDQNYFDYNLLANPLNPVNPFVSTNVSPHNMDTTRNMGDFNLTLFPQSKVRVRLGYSRYVNQGPAGLSYHEATEVLLNEDFRSASDRYQVGVDVKPFARTIISFDETYEHAKNDTTARLPALGNFLLPNGQPVDIGQTYNPSYNEPSAAPFQANGSVNPACNLYLNYTKSGASRTNVPTSQLSFTSSYVPGLELSGSGTYGWADSKVNNFLEQAQYFWAPNNERAFQYSGPIHNATIESNADFAMTYHLTPHWSFSDKFRFVNWRSQGNFPSTSVRCFANAPTGTATILSPIGTPVGTPVNGCPALANTLGIPTSPSPSFYGGGSDPDFGLDTFTRFLGQRSYYNTAQFNWDLSRKFGAHVGYKYGSILVQENVNDSLDDFGSNVPSNPAPGETVTPPANQITRLYIHQQSLLAGFVARPITPWNISVNSEFTSANHPNTTTVAGVLTPTDTDWYATLPLHTERLKVHSSYRAAKRTTVSGSINYLRNRNDSATAFPPGIPSNQYSNHSISYSLNFNVRATGWASLNAGWTYQDINVNAPTCLPMSTGGGVTVIPLGGPITSCTSGNGSLPVVFRYQENINNGYAMVMLKPAKRVTLNAGYNITSSSGSDVWLRADSLAPLLVPANAAGLVLVPNATTYPANATQYVTGPNPAVPLGPLGINWHKPSAAISVDVAKQVTLKGSYNYYDYNEKSLEGPVQRRDFHTNMGTVSLKYWF